MGKRSNFKRRPQDAYDTPPEAVAPLLPHLPDRFSFWEPCAGKGDLVHGLVGKKITGCWFTDIEPRAINIDRADALDKSYVIFDFIITNPPWTRQILHPMIEHFSALSPTWLLFDADWMHTKQSEPYMKWCRKIVSVGRVKWIPDSPHTGKDNCAWYLFNQKSDGPAVFCGRQS